MFLLSFVRIIRMNTKTIIFFISICALFYSCMEEKVDPDYKGYPHEIGAIITTKCAIKGCHDEVSKSACGGLCLESWNKMFEGYKGGATTIPYRSDFSTLFFSCNVYSDLGITLTPTMPYNKANLSREEIITIRNWIDQGAADEKGVVKFSDNPYRSKLYVSHLLCDEVAVFDYETLLPMRYISVGKLNQTEYTKMISVSPDGNYCYAVFIITGVIQKFRTSDDSFVSELNLGLGAWWSFAITSDSKKAFCINYDTPGGIQYIDLETMTSLSSYNNNNNFKYLFGVAINNSSTFLYVAPQFGNYIYKINISDPANLTTQEITLDGTVTPILTSSLDPYSISFSPDETKYYVTCVHSNEVRVMQTSNDSLLKTISLSSYPQQISFSKTTPYFFVSCPDDSISFPGLVGSVSVINQDDLTLVKRIYTGFNPYGMAVDDTRKMVYVTNMNTSSNGLMSHHTGTCGGKNGYITFIDLNTLSLIPDKKIEVSVSPYSISIRK